MALGDRSLGRYPIKLGEELIQARWVTKMAKHLTNVKLIDNYIYRCIQTGVYFKGCVGMKKEKQTLRQIMFYFNKGKIFMLVYKN